MGIFNEALADITVKWKTKKIGENHGNAILVEWIEDHSEWKSKIEKHVKAYATEQREMPFGLRRVKEEKAGDNPQGKWNPRFPHSRLESHEKEIWGVIRAEYFYLMLHPDKPWNKIACKIGRTGIDSLWEHSDGRLAVCESKASKNQAKFEKYKARKIDAFDCLGEVQDPSLTQMQADMREVVRLVAPSNWSKKRCADLLDELIELMKENDPDCITTAVVQMDREWVAMKIEEMLLAGGAHHTDRKAQRKKVKENGAKVQKASKTKTKLERWFNYYGRDPFYRLPGKYKITGATSAEFALSKKKVDHVKEHEWGFPDKVETAEFIHLDKYKPWNDLEQDNAKKRQQERKGKL
jgi:hypothetical protein